MTDNVFAPPRASLDVQEGPEALWDMPWKDLRKLYSASSNIRALGGLYGIGAFGSIAALVFLSMAAGAAQQELPYSSTAVLVFVVAVAVIYVAACVSSYTRPRWGRWVGVGICVLSLVSFPLGTLIGALGLVAYARAGKLFGPGRLLHKDVAAVYKERKKEKR